MVQTYDNYYRKYYRNNKKKIYENRREKALVYNKQYYQKHKEEIKVKRSDPESKIHNMWIQARQKALVKNLPFTIKEEDIVVPELCPLLGVRLVWGVERGVSPSLDRVIPSLGYTKENIKVISMEANRMKQEITLDFAKKLIEYLN